MSKRKRAQPPADDSTGDESTKDDMVHVTSDLLSGGSDAFTSKKTEDAVSPEPEKSSEPEPEAEAPAEPEPTVAEAETAEPSETLVPEEAAPAPP